MSLVIASIGTSILLTASFLAWVSRITPYRLVISLLVCSILVPGIRIPGLFIVRPEELLLVILLPMLLIRIRWHWGKVDLAFALIVMSTAVSLLWGNAQGIPLAIRDAMEFVKLLKYWLLFHVAFCPWGDEQVKGIVRCVVICAMIASVVGMLQWANWWGMGSFLSRVYGQGSVHVFKSHRVVGTMRNPNDFGLLLATGLSLSIGILVLAKRRFVPAMATLFIGASIPLTLSRSGVLASTIVVAVILIGSYLGLRRVSASRFVFVGMVGILAISVVVSIGVPILIRESRALENMDNYERVEYTKRSVWHALLFRFSVIDETGLPARLAKWQDHLGAFRESPIWGLGPGKSSYTSVVDSEYILYLRRYGIVGLVLLMGLYTYILDISLKGLRRAQTHSRRRMMGLCLVAILCAYLAANFFVTTFYQLQLMSVFWTLVGVTLSGFRWLPTRG